MNHSAWLKYTFFMRISKRIGDWEQFDKLRFEASWSKDRLRLIIKRYETKTKTPRGRWEFERMSENKWQCVRVADPYQRSSGSSIELYKPTFVPKTIEKVAKDFLVRQLQVIAEPEEPKEVPKSS